MRINLLPPEVLERQRTRRQSVAAAAIGVIVLLAIVAFYILQVFQLGEVEDDVADQRLVNTGLQQEIAALQDVAVLQQEIEATRTLLNTLLVDRVLWSGILRDISLVIPGEVWLSGLSGTTGAPTTTDETATTTTTFAPGEGLVGQIAFDGAAFTHRDVALWLSRLEDVRGFTNPWLSNSTKTTTSAPADGAATDPAATTPDPGLTITYVSFSSSVDLNEQALARRRDEVPG